MEARYDTTTIVFHWVMAILLLIQWLWAQIIDWFPRGPLRVDARSFHITLGMLLVALLTARIIWRLTKGRHLPPSDSGILGQISKATHLSIYFLLAAMMLVGVALTWVRGDNIFNLFHIPAYDPGDHALRDQVQEVHAAIGWVIVAIAGVHTVAALGHRYILRDSVLNRMLFKWPEISNRQNSPHKRVGSGAN
jgi:cytochrome b561